jgi:hypothetical protein
VVRSESDIWPSKSATVNWPGITPYTDLRSYDGSTPPSVGNGFAVLRFGSLTQTPSAVGSGDMARVDVSRLP